MKKKITVLVIFLFQVMSTFSQGNAEFFKKSDVFFKSNVKNGRVSYNRIKEDSATLNELLEIANKTSISKDNDKEYQAFWINIYNLLVIHGVVENYPLKSPLDVAGFFDERIHYVGGIQTTLNDIENVQLRKNYPKEARFHFVLVCGGLGCPPIIEEAYTPNNLEIQLDRQTRLAINNQDFIRVKNNKVKLSQIFEWYASDFKVNGTIVDFINIYREEKLPIKAKLSYYEYDWALNEIIE